MGLALLYFLLSFYYLPFLIAEISFVFIASPPWPFQQACDEYNVDGLDALYHHLVLVLFEIGHSIIMKYSSTHSNQPAVLPLLIHAMRLCNPVICLII